MAARPRPHSARLTCLVSLAVFATAPAHGQVLDEFTPRAGLPGQSVTIGASDLDPLASYVVTVSGIAATVEEVQEDFLRFTIPTAPTGTLAVSIDGGAPIEHPEALTVLRSITAGFAPGIPLDTTGYVIGTVYGDGTPAGPDATVRVTDGESTLVVSSRDDQDAPDLLAFSTDTTTDLDLGAASTAAALVFLHPDIATADPDDADTTLAGIAGLTETSDLASLIDAHLLAGTDYKDDAAFEPALIAAAGAWFAQASGGGSGAGALTPALYAEGSPRDWPPVPGLGPNQTVTVAGTLEITDSARATVGLDFDGVESPLDWQAVASLLDIDQAPLDAGKDFFDARINDNTVYPRVRELPGQRRVTAFVFNRRWSTVQFIAEKLTGNDLLQPPFFLPADDPGVFVIRRYSGAIVNEQAPLVAGLPFGREKAARQTGFNATRVVWEALAPLIEARDVAGSGGFRVPVEQIERFVDRRIDELLESPSGLSPVTVAEMIVEAISAGGFSATATLTGADAFAGAAETVSRVAASLTVAPGIGSGRFRALVGEVPGFQAVESSGVVLGAPWSPEIQGFEPEVGHQGTLVTIFGRRFETANPLDNLVQFNAQLGTGGEYEIVVQGDVEFASETLLRVRVPAGVTPGIGPIAIRVRDRGAVTASEGVFEVLASPVLTGFGDPIVGKPLVIEGTGFSEVRTLNRIVFEGFGSFAPTAVGENALIFHPGPPTENPVNVRVDIEDGIDPALVAPSNTLVLDADPGFVDPTGAEIDITTELDNVDADCEVTLREAILWSSGAPFRDPTDDLPEPNTCPLGTGINGEIDFFSQTLYGAGVPDVVVVPTTLPGNEIENVDLDPALGPLAPLGAGDRFVMNDLQVDGGGTTGDGLVIGNGSGSTDRVVIEDLTIGNFTGNGILIDGSSANTLDNVAVLDVGGDGIRIQGSSADNRLEGVAIDNADVHGLHLTGPVARTVCVPRIGQAVPTIGSNGGYGIVLEGGATGNLIECGDVFANVAGGIWVGPDSPGNQIGPHQPFAIVPQSVSSSVSGPGLRIESSDTSVRLLTIDGNGGAGVSIHGPDAPAAAVENVTLESLRIGYATPLFFSFPNQGPGIVITGRVSRSRIGAAKAPIGASPPLYIADNVGPGIRLAGPEVHSIQIRDARIGATERLEVGEPPVLEAVVLPNGQDGIVLEGGTHDNVLGATDETIGLEIVGQPGAGISIEGEGSSGNLIAQAKLGFLERLAPGDLTPFEIDDAALANGIGISIRDGASDNQIGGPAQLQALLAVEDRAVKIGNAIDAGILIEGLSTDAPTRGNSIRNTVVGLLRNAWDDRAMDGVRISGPVAEIFVGGNPDRDPNTIRGLLAGVAIVDATPLDPEDPTVIVLANDLTGSGDATQASFDAVTGVPDPVGVGVLIDRSQGALIGEFPGAPGANTIGDNLVGIYLRDSSQNEVFANEIAVNAIAGAILENATDNTLSSNTIVSNGPDDRFDDRRRAGVLLHLGGANEIAGNSIGIDAAGDPAGNKDDGIQILDSAQNRIGSARDLGRNEIGSNVRDGIRIEGPVGVENLVVNNTIGDDASDADATYPNGAAGVRLLGGASRNTIGGVETFLRGSVRERRIIGNTIRGNPAGGIVVEGAATRFNAFRFNSIFNHALPTLGIDLLGGGNAEIPAPTLTNAVPLTGETEGVVAVVEGFVDDTEVDDGSEVQVFADDEDEGRTYVGSATVENGIFQTTVVVANGTFLNATVTEPSPFGLGVNLETSEFGGSIVIAARLAVERDPDGVVPDEIEPGATDQVLLPLRVTALDADTDVFSLRIEATGSLLDDLDIEAVNLFEDTDGDGTVSVGDGVLAGPAVFTEDDGSLVFSLGPTLLFEDVPQRWIVAVDLAADAPLGGIFGLQVPDRFAIDAMSTGSVSGRTAIVGAFPIEGDSATVAEPGGGGFTDAAFQGLGQMPGISADRDGNVQGISADGQVITGSANSLNATFEAYRWSFDAPVMDPLGDLPGGAFFSRGQGASSDGSVVVGFGRADTGDEPARWTQATGLVGLGLPGAAATAVLRDVSGDGNTAVGDSSATGLFRYVEGSGYDILGELPGGSSSVRAGGISDDASVLVGRDSSDNGTEAFRYTDGGGFEPLGDLDGGAFSSSAEGISADNGTIVGSGTSGAGTEAVYWNAPGSPISIGDLDGGSVNAVAFDASADGSVIVGRANTDAGTVAFVWDAATGMRNLQDVLEGQFGVDLTGWTLIVAIGISDDGSVITGNGTNPSGGTEPWVVQFSGGGSGTDDADANGDGFVDGADYTIWADNFGRDDAIGPEEGDFDGDGLVDAADLAILESQFGTMP